MAISFQSTTPRVCEACGVDLKRRRRQPRPCLCGCGSMTRGGRFRPGHDAKLSQFIHRLAVNSRHPS
jgi:hypothetical protein